MDFATSLKYLYSLGHEVLAAKFGLENINVLLEMLGHPQLAFKSILVAGTNGKGSVAAMIDSIARTAGYKSALFTSPHLLRIQERIKVSGREISEEAFAKWASTVREAVESLVSTGRLAAPPTFFEQVAAIALCYFRSCEPELAVLEVGLGGRLDATNAVDRIISVVTSIELDHQNILGNTIEEIAAEKAAIIVKDARAVIGRQNHRAATEVLMNRCLETGVLPVFTNEPTAIEATGLGSVMFNYESAHTNYVRIAPGLRGRHQADNAAAAIEAAELLNESGFSIPRESIIKGLRSVSWLGRLELINDRPAILLDGAHNPAGARALRKFLDEFCSGPITLIFAAMSDKDIERMAVELFDVARTIVLTRVRDARAADSARLGGAALRSSRNVIFAETVRQALSWARSVTPPEGLVCVAGSLYLVGEVKRLIEEADSQTAVL
ncbi:MAG TPA: folylpolyglutamate synthase/dihydrofolate synthase family protein [Blastocatellia bacterium]|nr:folylpolyglutamate synthase/dihydrofolate synthase family protein [Blastocatellia bacterium]